ncbi:site-2 protease family protein [Eubacteriales bacterium OttesenSCG-928-A19]|nr:site-2 protease family protein [Eubacteriales bacterium OttesenSCG-928-A19]
MIDALINDPKWFFEFALYRIPAVLIALVFHEWAHGYVAYRLGDPTAKQMGRLSLNPLKHLDPVGTLMMFFLGFGWAKPVPINPTYFKNPHRDDLLVSIAGIVMNLLLFLLFTILTVVLNQFLWHPQVFEANSLHDLLGFKDGVINYILAGYGNEFSSFFARPGFLWAVRLTSQIAMVNMYIAIFNLIPIPPLDGSHLVNDLFFKGKLFVSQQTARIGFAVMMVLSFTGILGKVMGFLGDGLQAGVLSIISAVMRIF